MSANEIAPEAAEKILAGIKIPPRPSVLIEITDESRRPHPDIRKIAQLIAKDIGLSASMLKLVNSPYFGLSRKIDDPQQAVTMLGMTNVMGVVTGLVLKGSLGGGVNLERFWDTADRVANISAKIANKLPDLPKESAFTFGLFRDCGIPILMQKFPDYKDTLQLANANAARKFTQVEDERHSTNHAVVGYLLAKSWGLSEDIYQAIYHHHEMEALTASSTLSGLSRSLIAVAYLAEYIFDSMRMRGDDLWATVGDHVMNHLGISQEELDDIKEDVIMQYS